MPLFLAVFPATSVPSMLVPNMPLREFAARMQPQPDSKLPPLVYPTGESYYMQSPLWPGILQDVDLAGPPFCHVTAGMRMRTRAALLFWAGFVHASAIGCKQSDVQGASRQ